MTVAVTPERLEATLAYLKRLAARGRPAPTNKQIALCALRMGQQRYQPVDRTLGIKWPKAEHGAVMIRALEELGAIAVERGSNRRRIIICETGQILEPRKPCTDGSGWRRQVRQDEAA